MAGQKHGGPVEDSCDKLPGTKVRYRSRHMAHLQSGVRAWAHELLWGHPGTAIRGLD